MTRVRVKLVRCRRCQQVKPVYHFQPSELAAPRQPWCRACKRVQNVAQRTKGGEG